MPFVAFTTKLHEGAGVYLVKGNTRKPYRITDECIVIEAEILIIIKTTELIIHEVVKSSKGIDIYVDRQAVLKP